MAFTSFDIDQQHRLRVILLGAIEKDLIYGKRVEPVLAVCKRPCHEGVEVARHRRIIDQVLERPIFGVERMLRRAWRTVKMFEASRFEISGHSS
jgi:hypothetical protein